MIAQLRQEGDRCLVFTQFVRWADCSRRYC